MILPITSTKIGRRGRARTLLLSPTMEPDVGMRVILYIICFLMGHAGHTRSYELAYVRNGGGVKRAFGPDAGIGYVPRCTSGTATGVTARS